MPLTDQHLSSEVAKQLREFAELIESDSSLMHLCADSDEVLASLAKLRELIVGHRNALAHGRDRSLATSPSCAESLVEGGSLTASSVGIKVLQLGNAIAPRSAVVPNSAHDQDGSVVAVLKPHWQVGRALALGLMKSYQPIPGEDSRAALSEHAPILSSFARAYPNSWFFDRNEFGELLAEERRNLFYRYATMVSAMEAVIQFVEHYPEVLRSTDRSRLRDALKERIQILATAQAGVRTEIEELSAAGRLHRTKRCPFQTAVFGALRSIVSRDHLAMTVQDMKRDSRVAIETSKELMGRINVLTGRRPSRVAKPAAPEVPEAVSPSRFASVLEAFAAARDEFGTPGGPVVFTAHALESAGSCAFRRPDDAYQALKALAMTTLEWNSAPGGAMGKSFQQRLRELGFDEKFSSQTAVSRWQREYTMPFEGRSVPLSQHITLGSGNSNTCMSIHWFRDEETRRTIIGHCGRHLTNTMS